MNLAPSDLIALRKLHELSRETVAAVVDQIPAFVEATRAAYAKDPSKGWYSAMQTAVGRAPSPFLGIGGPPREAFTLLHQVVNAYSFYSTNISQGWKEAAARELGVSLGTQAGRDEVYAEWRKQVRNGSEIPADMMIGREDSLAAYPKAWWSPDPRTAVPSSSTIEQADQDFFLQSHVVSLAPEWYPQGLVRIGIDLSQLAAGGKQGVARPDSYDGMTSPLWVQHPPNENAATGDEARETLNAEAVLLRELIRNQAGDGPAVQAYAIGEDLSVALENSPSVNVYSVDLDKVSSDPVLGAQERGIVEEVRQARARANAGFDSTTDNEAPAALQSLIEEVQSAAKLTRVQEPTPPVEPSSSEDWRRLLEEVGAGGSLPHRGYRFAHEPFEARINADPEVAEVILDAAAELLAESVHPGVLSLVGALGVGTDHRAFLEALVKRLDQGPALPEGAGIRNATLEADLQERLREPHIATDAALSPRAHHILQRAGRPDLRLALAAQHDFDDSLLALLGESIEQFGDALDPHLVAIVGHELHQHHTDGILEASRLISELPTPTRLAFHDQVKGGPEGDESARLLGLV